MPLYPHLARELLRRHDLSALRQVTVLLPTRAAAQPLAQALSAAAGQAVWLPRLTTLADGLAAIALPQAVESDLQRVATLYQVLRDQGWFGETDLWGVAEELLTLIDQLTRHAVHLPATAEDFATQLAAAYQARSGHSLQFEARVVHELWFAMNNDAPWDSVRAEQYRLAHWAAQLDGPLYVLRNRDAEVAETRFLQQCAERVPVTVFDLRELAADWSEFSWLRQALYPGNGDLPALAQRLPATPQLPDLQIFSADGLEQEAEAAELQIRRWLLEGRQDIAVVVLDRLVARRMRALLERAEVRVQDETGWTFATLAVSTPLKCWLDCLQNDFYHLDVLNLLKSPYLLADQPALVRRQLAFTLEKLLRRHGTVARHTAFAKLLNDNAPECLPAWQQIQSAIPAHNRRQPLVEWLRGLHDSAQTLGLVAGWSRDPAGQQLLQLLKQWAEALQNNRTRFSFGEWRRWLAQQLEANTFRDMRVTSPVRFTHLAATRGRRFDAVLLVGCDAAHLPAPARSGQWFNDSVRASLGLPTTQAALHQVRDDLFALLTLNPTVLATWQAHQSGEVNLLSPHLEMLRALANLQHGASLEATELAALLPHTRLRPEAPPAPDAPPSAQPSVPAERLPTQISPSGYNSLVACPYQFYARYVLHLNDLDEVRETLDKRDYGTWVHAVLQRFHDQEPLLLNLSADQAATRLQQVSEAVFARALEQDYEARAWLLRWQAQIPGYIDWQRQREQDGWRYQAAEQEFAYPVDDQLTLKGRTDRIDRQHADPEQRAVLDYKTQSSNALKAKLAAPGEDVQLACYALAQAAQDAAFVSLDGDPASIAPEQPLPDLAADNLARLQTLFQQMRTGTPLPANGSACDYCEMRGLCRRE